MEIHELKAQGVSIREISRRLGYSRNTVRKWLRARTPQQRKARAPQPSKLDPFKDYVRCRMAEDVYNTNKLYKEIKSLGYSGGRGILKSYVEPFRPPAKPSAVVGFDTLTGEHAQVDFGASAYEDGLGRHRIYAFVMVVSWSRALYVELVEKCDPVTLLRRCVANVPVAKLVHKHPLGWQNSYVGYYQRQVMCDDGDQELVREAVLRVQSGG